MSPVHLLDTKLFSGEMGGSICDPMWILSSRCLGECKRQIIKKYIVGQL